MGKEQARAEARGICDCGRRLRHGSGGVRPSPCLQVLKRLRSHFYRWNDDVVVLDDVDAVRQADSIHGS